MSNKPNNKNDTYNDESWAGFLTGIAKSHAPDTTVTARVLEALALEREDQHEETNDWARLLHSAAVLRPVDEAVVPATLAALHRVQRRNQRAWWLRLGGVAVAATVAGVLILGPHNNAVAQNEAYGAYSAATQGW